MPSHHRGRPLKAWRYVGVYGPELMLCAATVRVGRARRSFWAVWDRRERRLHEGHAGVSLDPGRMRIAGPRIHVDLALEEVPGIETICPTATGYAWTRKQGGVASRGTIELDGERHTLEAQGLIDDTAAYYDRHTSWRWSAGVGTAHDGRALAWNLVEGVNDPPANSERTVWLDGEASESPPVVFATDLSRVGGLRFQAEATRERNENLLLVRSRYRQPFGTFSGSLPGDIELAEGYGVMEDHEAWW
jgi:hypothetical protein